MRLKQILTYTLLASTLVACDKIDESERTIGPLPFEARKSILIEDFTGQRCLNCPKAADEAHKLQQQYGTDKVIVVGIHAGGLSIPESKGGLATDWGEEYAKYWKAESFPIGLIDQVDGLFDFPQWTARAYQRLQLTSPVELTLTNSYNKDTRTATIQVTSAAKERYKGKIQVWLTENKIVSLQTMPNGKPNISYEHNHVFRTALYHATGDAETDKELSLHGELIEIASGKEITTAYTTILKEKYVAENITVVAFVHNENGVTQTTTGSLIENN